MRRLVDGLAGIAGISLAIVQIVIVSGTSMGVVREHCIDVESSAASQSLDVDSGWTYILWPPLTLANLDPSGRCLRNSPLREGVSKVGIWKLKSPEEQVIAHLRSQGLLEAEE